MKKANNVLRRSSVKLKSLSTGNADLQLIISQIKDVRCSFKSFMDAQEVLAEDLYAWSQKLDNDALQSSFSYMLQISALWTEAQKNFYDALKKYKSDFELILEGERHVSQAKKIVDTQEELEVKAKRELQKATRKDRSSLQDIEVLRAKVSQVEKSKELARIDFSEKLRENEAVRMIRVKGSAMQIGSAYHEMSTKCCSLFHAHHLISQEIPDVHGKELHNVRHRVNACKDYMKRAEDQVGAYRPDVIKSPNTNGPQRSRSDTAVEQNNYGPATAPSNSLSSSMASVAISGPAGGSVYPDIKLNNFDTDCSNEKSHYRKMSAQPPPLREGGGNGESGESSLSNNLSSQDTPPPFNPYYHFKAI